jgi:preprotein translocase subunit SecG
MAPFRWIAWLTGALWRFSRRSWIDTGVGLRPRSPASALVLFLFLIFFLIGLVLVLLGFDLGAVDAALDAQAGRIDAVASFLFRAVSGLVILLCLLTIGSAILERGKPDRPGAGCALAAVLVAYFAWFGLTGD